MLKKAVDPSVLSYGFTIPTAFHDTFFDQLGFTLRHGEERYIKMLCDGIEYTVKLKNIGFNKDKFDHTDILQVRYSEKSDIALHFQEVFSDTVEKVRMHYASRSGNERYRPDQGSTEYLAVYATPITGTLMVDCITRTEYQAEAREMKALDELLLENMIDSNATIEIKDGQKKVRRLTKAIGDSLKLVYGYRCQICGQYIGEPYGSNVIHAHHIDYFVKSMNNNADNIMIVCPNHHSIIHDRNPIFDRNKVQYCYPNGYTEGLILNKHL